MDTITYKGFEIKPTPMQLRDSGKWTMDLAILRHRGNRVTERQFSAGNTFETKEEAILHCFNFGKQIIDGKSENCSVDDL